MAQYTLVKRAVAAYHLDGPDEGAEPDRHKVTGNITFTPMLRPGEAVTMMEDNRPITLVPLPVEARISDGVIFHRGVEGVMLLAGGEKMNPDKLLWKAEFKHLQSNGKSFSLTPVVFEAVPGGEVDLSLVAPPPGRPVGTIRGRDGDTIEEMVHEGGELVLTIRHGDGKTSERRVDVRAVAEGVAGEALSDAREYAGTVADSMARFEELGRQTAADRVSAGESAGAAGEAAEAAAGSAVEAGESASSASSSAGAAESHAKRAGSHANEAGSHASAASESAKSASASAEAASGSSDAARREADRAAERATAAEASAGEASAHADRAEGVAESVQWDDDRLTVAGKTSPPLRGPKGDKGEAGGARGMDIQGSGTPPNVTGARAFAVGWGTVAAGDDSAAVGVAASAGGVSSTALGRGARAMGENSTALAISSEARGGYSTAVGAGARAMGENSTALAISSEAREGYSTAVGYWAQAKHQYSSAVGTYATTTAEKQVRIGSANSGYHVSLAGDVRLTRPPSRADNATTKTYVDGAVSEAKALAETRARVKQVASPPDNPEPGVLYVIPE